MIGMLFVAFIIVRSLAVIFAESAAEDYAFRLAERAVDSGNPNWMQYVKTFKEESEQTLFQFLCVHRWTMKQLYPKLTKLGEANG